PKIMGAGIHRNPTPTPDGRKFVYGHVWVTLSAIARHQSFGTIGLPLLAKLYVKAKDIKMAGMSFKSKTEQAAELAQWAYDGCKSLGKQLWIVTDGGFTRASYLKPVIKTGAVVVTRLRKDAVLYAELKQSRKRDRGRPRKYGKRLKLANRVNSPDGWFTINAVLYGKEEVKEVNVFKALYKPAGCLVQVLIVRESKDCFRAFLCTDLTASAVEILEAVAHRYAIEQNFSDLKEILHSLVELWAWDKPAKVLCDRSDSPWDDAYRRPSHADKCAALRREVLKETFFIGSDKSHKINKIHKQFYKLLKLVA
ncbi:MAG: transposase, partial [Planctomycetota bacterium]|nr:transposase [Planctomycetota bacterium]